MTTGVIGALALAAGCTAKPATSNTAHDQQPDLLALMIKDAPGTVRKVADTTGKATSVTVTMTGTAAGQKLDLHGVIGFGQPPQAEFTTTVAAMGDTTVRMLGTVCYVQVPAAERGQFDGKSWMKMDLAQLGKEGMSMTKQFDDMDPSKQVRTLLDSGTLSAVGREDVDGVKTVHYAGSAPIDKYLTNLDDSIRSAVQQQLTAQGATEVKTDLWVDDQYLPRRIHTVMGTTDLTGTYSDYGKPVSVAAPPASDTVDFGDLMNSLKDLTTGD